MINRESNVLSLSKDFLFHMPLSIRLFRHLASAMGLLSFLFGGCGAQPSSQSSGDQAPEQFLPTDEISFSQLDITESFGDNERLKPDEWISTVPLNQTVSNGQSSGLPPTDATDDEIYAVAERMSRIRESILISGDGIYCPVCHIANTQLAKLRTPCPKCGRPLLKFGWE